MDIFDRHQMKIARDTLKMSPAGASIMGGMNHSEAVAVLLRGNWSRARIEKALTLAGFSQTEIGEMFR